MLAPADVNIPNLHAAVSALNEIYDLEGPLGEFWAEHGESDPDEITLDDDTMEALCAAFGEIIDSMEEADVEALPESVTDFYQELFAEELEGGDGIEEEETSEEVEEVEEEKPAKGKAAKATSKAPAKEEKPAKAAAKSAKAPAKEEKPAKAEKPAKPAKEEKKAAAKPAKAEKPKKEKKEKPAGPGRTGNADKLAQYRGSEKNRYGASVGCGTDSIDQMLEAGKYTKDEIAEKVGTPKSRVQTRIYSLKAAGHIVQAIANEKKPSRIELKLTHKDDYKPKK